MVSEEKIKMWKFTTYDKRTPSDGKSSPGLWPGELKITTIINKQQFLQKYKNFNLQDLIYVTKYKNFAVFTKY